jgi:hypothetical protein
MSSRCRHGIKKDRYAKDLTTWGCFECLKAKIRWHRNSRNVEAKWARRVRKGKASKGARATASAHRV